MIQKDFLGFGKIFFHPLFQQHTDEVSMIKLSL